jgi:uncharacterized protein YkwD
MKKIAFFLLLALGLTATASAYSDVSTSDPITWVTEQNLMHGYSDGSFKPDQKITRAEFVKTLLTLAPATASSDEDCFNDVASTDWFAPFVCSAHSDGLVKGYSDGSFAPAQPINVVEASKLILSALALTPNATVQGTEWYSAALETLGDLNAYPDSLHYLNQNLTRGELADMLWRLETTRTDQPHTAWTDFSPACTEIDSDLPASIDLKTVMDTWLGWTNATRATQGLSAYTYNDQLSRTATIWSQYSKGKGSMSHKRPGTTAYYDYYAIQDWFANLGLTFKNDSGVTFTENIAHGPYSCDSADCTQEVIDAMRYSYDYFISEAGKSYSPHWNSIVSSHFKEIGFGLAVDSNSYYVTVHYATAITSDPAPLCTAL